MSTINRRGGAELLRGIPTTVVRVLVHPREFFRTADGVSFGKSLGVVTLMALLHAAAVLPVAYVTARVASGLSGGLVTTLAIAALWPIYHVLVVFLTWIGGSLIAHGIVLALSDSRGRVRDTFGVVGWSFTTYVFVAAVHALGIAYTIFVTDPLVVTVSDYQMVVPAVEQAAGGPIHKLSHVLALPFIAWIGVVAGHGLSEVHDVSLRRAALAIGLPLVAWMILLVLVEL